MRVKRHWLIALGFIVLGAYIGFQGLFPEKRIPLQDLEGSLDEVVALAEAGDTEGALRELDLLSSESISLEARSLRASLLAKTDPERARSLANGLIGLPLGDRAVGRLVDVWIRLEEPERARNTLGVVPQGRPLSLPRYLAAAKVALFSDRDGAAAYTYLGLALRLDPKHVETRQILARILFESERIVDQVRAKSITRELDQEGRVPFELLVQMLFNQKTPLFAEELSHYTKQLLDHPNFEDSSLASNLGFYRVISTRLRFAGDNELLWRVDRTRSELPGAETIDFQDLLETGLRANRIDELGRTMADLETRLDGDPRLELANALSAHVAGEDEEALRWVTLAMEKGDPGAILTEAVAYLSNARPLSSSMALWFAERLVDTPGINISAALVGANTLLVNADSALQSEVIEKLVSKFKDEPEVLFEWLRVRNLLREAMDLGVVLIEGGQLEFVPRTIDLAVRLNEIEIGSELMSKYEDSMAQNERKQASIRLAYGGGDLSEAERLWDLAWSDAAESDDFVQMTSLAYLAASVENFERARKAADLVLEQGLILQAEMFIFLARGEVQEGDYLAARDYLDKAVIFYPEKDELKNDSSYLSILLGDSSASLIARMESILVSSPSVETFRFTMALARLDAGQAGSAAKLLDTLEFDEGNYQPASWGIWAAVLFTSGDLERARIARSRCDADKLLSLEREYLEEFWK